jgi:hypothetical protein
MKKSGKLKEIVLEQLRKTPIIEAACQKADISRMTFYRWKKEDQEFAKKVDEALLDGRLLVNDLAENQLIGAVKDRNLSAVQYWLRHHHPSYANKLQISHENQNDELTPEQEEIVRKALELAAASQTQIINEKDNHDQSNHDPNNNDSAQSNSAGTSGNNDPGQESKDSDN